MAFALDAAAMALVFSGGSRLLTFNSNPVRSLGS